MSFTRSKENGELFEPEKNGGRGILGIFGRKVTAENQSESPSVQLTADSEAVSPAGTGSKEIDPETAAKEAAAHRAAAEQAGLLSSDLFRESDQATLVKIDQNKDGSVLSHANSQAPAVNLEDPDSWDGQGPYLYGEGPANLPRFDLGVLKLPLLPGLQMMPVLNEQGQMVAVELIYGTSQMQISLYSSSRLGGLWEEALPSFKSILHTMEFQLFDLPTPYGEGFLGRPVLIGEDQDAQEIMAGLNVGTSIIDEMSEEELDEALNDPFVPLGMDLTKCWQNALSEHPMSTLIWAVEGERWLLRVIFRGQAAEEETERADLLRVLRLLEIDRGSDPHTPGEVLPLTLPVEVVQEM